MTVANSKINDNSAGGAGGGIDNVTGNSRVTASTISDNSAGLGGGGIHSASGNLTVSASTISDNSAGTNGGGIENRYGGLTLINSTISGNSAAARGGGVHLLNGRYATTALMVTDTTISGNSAGDDGGGIFSGYSDVIMTSSTISGNSASGNGGGLYVLDSASAIRHSTVTDNSADTGGGGAFIFGGSLALDHTILAANMATFGPDLTGLISTIFDVHFSLIGNNAHSGLTATPNGLPDSNGNLIGPVVAGQPLIVSVEIAAMGDFEAGLNGDSFLFEYSIDGGALQPLLTSSVDEAGSQTYLMDIGTQVVRDDPMSVNGVLLNRNFQTVSAVIPASSGQIRVRFTGTNDGPSEAFVWRNLVIYGQDSGSFVGAAVGFQTANDVFAAYTADPDYTIAGDMFGIRSRLNRGIPGLPSDVVDDSLSIFPADTQGIISEFDDGRFFGVVDTVNGVGGNIDTATWTFNNVFLPLDPKLGPLADKFGSTMTHALLADSPARNMGNPAAMTGVGGVPQFDQRGGPFGRVSGGRIDIGAYELRTLPRASLVVNTLADESDGNFGPGDLSLREAISLAKGSFGHDTITFAAALTSDGPASIQLARGELAIGNEVTIAGPGQHLLTIDASANDPTPDENNGDGSRIFNVDDGFSTAINVAISSLTLTGADMSYPGGGAIQSFENLMVTDSTISGNSAGGSGGGIYSSRSNLTVVSSTIGGNTGGGIYSRDGNLTVTDSTISGNSAGGSGGGILGRYSRLMISGSTISGNSTLGEFSQGGGIAGGEVTITDSTIGGNSAGAGGGGISAREVTVTNSTISGNSTARDGGGIDSRSGSVTLSGSTISDNSAGFDGGGIASHLIRVTDSTISGNSAGRSGGGINGRYMTITNSTISGNSAGLWGGGIFSGDFGIRTLTNSTITSNEAPDGQGSGVASSGYASSSYSARTEVRSTIIAGNVHSDVDFVNGPRNWFQSNGYNLIGTGNAVGEFVELGDQTGVADPLLGALAENGGPTMPDGSEMQTHALLPGSPAIDAGDPGVVFNPAEHDQRGAPYARVSGGGIDVGAFEVQSIIVPADLLGDYNQNGVVDAADYVVWRKTLNQSVAPFSGADGDGNGMVQQPDYGVWRAHFGETSLSGAGSGAIEASSVESQELKADAPVVGNIAANYIGHFMVPIPRKTISAPAESDAAAARAASFALFETRSLWHDSRIQPRRTAHRYHVADFGGDNLTQLLAIHSVRQYSRQDSFVNDDSGNRDHRADDDDNENGTEELLGVMLAVP